MLILLFTFCSSEEEIQSFYEVTNNFEKLQEYEQTAIACYRIYAEINENFPDAYSDSKYSKYLYDYYAAAGIEEFNVLEVDFDSEEYQKYSIAILEHPSRFVDEMPIELRQNYVYQQLQRLQALASPVFEYSCSSSIYSNDYGNFYIEEIELLINDIMRESSLTYEDLCFAGSGVLIPIENNTLNQKENINCGEIIFEKLVDKTLTSYEIAYSKRLKAYEEAWIKNLKNDIEISYDELLINNDFKSNWDSKSNTEYLNILKVNGYTCIKNIDDDNIAWTNEINPYESQFSMSSTYLCKQETGIYLYGIPFFDEGKWWIYQTDEFNWDSIQCNVDCVYEVNNFASRFPIEFPEIAIPEF